jgi:pimeloyl-ACP methyl ester carboxylesterase
MMKTVLALFFSFASSLAFASTETCVAEFNASVAAKAALGVPKKHQPRLYLPENANGKVVVFLHGMFESPYFYKGISKTFQEQGYVTIVPTLPGHWEGDWTDFDRVSYTDWMAETDKAVQLARCFSDKIILAGHSTGGLLAIYGALQYPNDIVGLLLWSPAIKLTKLAWLGGPIGQFLHMSGNTFKFTKPDHDEITYYSPNSAIQLESLISVINRKYGGEKGLEGIYPKLTVPTFLAYAENDPVISVTDMTTAGYKIAGIKDVMYFPTNTGIWHESITKFPEDAYKFKLWDYNVKYRSMKEHVVQFLNKYL